MLLGILVTVCMSRAEAFDLSLIGFYQFGGAVDETTQEGGVFDPGEALGINGSGGIGVTAGCRLGDRTSIEFSWDRQFSALNHHTPLPGSDENIEKITDLDVDYLLIGMTRELSGSSLRPFVGGGAGMVRLIPAGDEYSTESSFAYAFIAGLRSRVSSRVFFHARTRIVISRMPEGSLFSDDYYHHKETFMPQMQLGVGIGISL